MSTPPTANHYDMKALHGARVHNKLNKELTGLTKSFYAMDNLASDDKDKSIVVAMSSTFEASGSRCVSVNFDKATASISYDNFSHGYKATTQKIQNIDVANLSVDQAVKAIVTEMAEIEPMFGDHVRLTNKTIDDNQKALADRQAILGRCGGPSSWS